MSRLTAAGRRCGCGCDCCADEPKSKEDEIAELMTLRASVERRLAELTG
jgi:hypothetical protein